MAGRGDVKLDIKTLLSKLDAKAEDGYGIVSFQAKALGKSKESIHLAVENGIIAVPLTEISSITPIPGRSAVEVLVEVMNGDRIRHLRRVPDSIRYPVPPGTLPEIGPFTWPPRVPPGGFPNTGSSDGGASTSTGECNGIDTTTTSAGETDQTDDYRQSCWHDTD